MKNDQIRFTQRKIKKNYRSITGHFPSVKNKTSVAFESKLEKALFLSLEFDNSVLTYHEQPQIEIEFRNKTKTYSADCYIQRIEEGVEKEILVEVKYSSEIEKDQEYFNERFNSIQKAAKKLGVDFEIYTEQNHSQIYLENLDFLYRYKENPLKNQYESQILEVLKENSLLSAYDLALAISSNPIDYALIANSIWDLVVKGKLKTDLEKEALTMKSLVELTHG